MRHRFCATPTAVGLPLLLVLAACSGGTKSLTLSSTCGDYFHLNHAARYDTAQRLSIAAHAQDAGNPNWGPQADAACGTLGNAAPLSRVFRATADTASEPPLSGPTAVITASATPLGGGIVTANAMELATRIIKNRLNAARLAAQVAASGNQLRVTVGASDTNAAKPLIEQIGLLRFRQVLGVAPGSITPVASGSPTSQAPPTAGSSEAPVPNAASTDLAAARQVFQSYDCVNGSNGPSPTAGVDQPSDYIVACDQTGSTKYLLARAAVEGSQISSADGTINSTTNQWLVQVNFNGSGKNDWFNLTKKAYEADPSQSPTACMTLNVTKGCNELAITLDGVVQSAPSSQQDGIAGGQTQITGQFTHQQAENLANVLKFGALPLRINISSVTTSQ